MGEHRRVFRGGRGILRQLIYAPTAARAQLSHAAEYKNNRAAPMGAMNRPALRRSRILQIPKEAFAAHGRKPPGCFYLMQNVIEFLRHEREIVEY